MALGGRRWLGLGLAVALVAGGGTAWAASHSDHGDPDRGGRILAALTTVERALPADAEVTLRQEVEPRWDSCDARAGTFGWDDVTVAVQFRSRTAARTLISDADTALRAAGWQLAGTLSSRLGLGARWTRTVSGTTVANATLAPGSRGEGTYWELDAVAPPQGHRVSGC